MVEFFISIKIKNEIYLKNVKLNPFRSIRENLKAARDIKLKSWT
jgi:hypothetical protein